ncbi:hypothetical protein Vretimale_17712 [Volvox reticuliferus]|uniref:Fe2OG dioxygenase domain-containing protein n=1 Tax=Volvox reticuliferus TaxID=1737510 RepID=A0A8J4LY68_9CHLO|nr:hypothetical protein Vretimale_17712 [Volvox reticuliferus]
MRYTAAVPGLVCSSSTQVSSPHSPPTHPPSLPPPETHTHTGQIRFIEDWRNCDDGSFKYMPRIMGDAVLFWGTKPNGDIDPHALHGGCPIKRGEKWVATKWIRSKGARGY